MITTIDDKAGSENRIAPPGSPEGAGIPPEYRDSLLSCVNEALAAADERFTITFWNAVAEGTTGWTSPETVGQPAARMFQLGHLSFEEMAGELLREGCYHGDLPCRRRDGSVIHIELHARVIRTERGGFGGAVASFRDITARKRKEAYAEYCRNMGKDFSNLFSSGEIARITGENMARYLGVSARLIFCEPDGTGDGFSVVYEYHAPGVPAPPGRLRPAEFFGEGPARELAAGRAVAAEDAAACAPGNPYSAGIASQFIAPYAEGGRLAFLIAAQHREPHRWQADEIELLSESAERICKRIGSARTEEKLVFLAGELEKKNRFVTDFFINISHEFKTPLTILMLGLELLEAKTRPGAPAAADIARHISVMKQNSYRLNRLVSNLLDITKLDAGFMEPKWELKNIVEWLGSVVASTEIYTRQKGLELSYSHPDGEKRMYTDGYMLDRIMLNLLSNAIKHTPPGGRIDVDCRTEEDRVTISVRDTGEGIPQGKRTVIFDRFSQVDTKLTRASEGSGIGLALTKSLVELMGGRIWFESEEGMGCQFFVELPAVPREGPASAAEQGGLLLEKRVQMEFSDIGLSAV